MITARSYITKMATSHLELLRGQKTLITAEVVRAAVALFSDGPAKQLFGDITEAEAEEVARDIETQFNVYVTGGGQLINGEGHIPWLEERRDSIDWKFWDRYRRYMIEDEGRSAEAFDKTVGDVTDRILESLENPLRPGHWERRGLVAGQVQSGKTSNYVGLINKAIDAGYKLIIVMAGAHDSLRSQTQQRINEGVLGFNTVETFSGSGLSSKTGVGLKSGPNLLINCSTTVESRGDFKLTVAKQAHQAIGGDPTVLVVKKNASILRNVFAWATELQHVVDPETGKKVVPGVPILVLDDEADYASIDTSTKPGEIEDETDPSTINGLIRKILDTFEKSAYVAYTATPFANIFIDPNASRSDIGLDLFPEHFIVRLPEPSNYSGPIRFFGLDGDTEAGLETVERLPSLRQIQDQEDWLRDGHKPTEVPDEELPASLKEAIQAFVLSCSVKRLRDLRIKHSSMLIHVTRFKDVQSEVARQVADYVDYLRVAVEFEDVADPDSVLRELKQLYLNDFVTVTDLMLANDDVSSECRVLPAWHELETELLQTLSEIEVQIVNGSVKDSLMYSQRTNGLQVIAIGGDKLSRGLTLEGLMVSYYLRASRMYDTLMQMGRWFGYRPGYLDLCRIYTTPQLIMWYSRITDATAKLYREFEVMGQLNRTPRQYGLRVQQHPDGLMVTAANKSRHSQQMKVSFAATQCETLLFDTDLEVRERNWSVAGELATSVFGTNMTSRGQHVEHDVPASKVLEFLKGYSGHRDSGRGLPQPLVEYIEKCLQPKTSELRRWTVMLGDRTDSENVVSIAGGQLGLYARGPFPTEQAEGKRTIKRLVSPGDVLRPLEKGSAAWEEALEWAIERYESGAAKPGTKRPEKPTAAAERHLRSKDQGFLMVYPIDPDSFGFDSESVPFVGFAVSFPASANGLSVNYRVNSVFWDELFDDEG